ncbi:hypothetical protein [Curtobacterium sp. MCBD17_040]|uniref:hypothetical protein n=1 Tax=Curtobacterium sp. MCBD17_040 TaxID=2175674 RepID=UPI0011B365BC|nr:hypothetical protein [Curtobacterium sp. MCBD17_040]WIB65664.1 hypothetical protein DEI94_16215 [Curtobacterium sp. MCBD17_040]
MSNPLRRWWRSRTDVVATFAVAFTLIAVNALAAQANVHIAGSLNANWRGAYDILVTAPGQDFGGSKTAGLVDSNFVSDAGTGGISLTQLHTIRGIANVEVAAPIGMVGTLRDLSLTPSLYIPDNPETKASVLTSSPELLRLTTTLSRNDRGATQVLSRTNGVVALQPREGSATALITSGTDTSMSYPSGFGAQTDDYSFQVPLGELPAFPASVIAIDPAAETKLWKGRANYLSPLQDASASRSAKTDAAGWASQVDKRKFLVQESNLAAVASDPEEQNDTVVPLVVNRSTRANLSVRVSIEKAPLTGALPTEGSQVQAAASTATWQPVGAVSSDASGVTRPFASPSLSLQWPGTKKPAGESGGVFYSQATSLTPTLIGRPDYSVNKSTGDKVPSFTVLPKGVTGPDGAALGGGFAATSGADPTAGKTRAYRSTSTPGGTGFGAALPAPIGTFTSSEAADTGTKDASYVPSGIGGGEEPTVASPAAGAPVTADSPVEQSLSNLSFLNSSPGAFTDLQGGATLRGSTPIDAVRIRVAGVHGYSEASRDRIAGVAQQIAKLGLTSTVVAGSSLQPVSVYVPKYFVDASAAHDLGRVNEEWTTLGASVTVSNAFTASTAALSVVAAVAVAFALVITQLLTARRRRAEAAILRTVGWTNATIRRRIFVSYLPGPAVVAVAAAGSLIIAAHTLGLIAWALSGALVLASFAAAVLGAQRSIASAQPHPRTRRRRQPASERDLAFRHLSATPGSTAAQAIGVFLFILATATGIESLAETRSAAGATRLADVVFKAGAAPLMLLIAAAAVGSLLLCLLGRRSEQVRRQAEQSVLRASGFTAGQRARIRQWEVLTIAVTASCAGTILVLAGTTALHMHLTAAIGAIAAAALATALLTAAARKET